MPNNGIMKEIRSLLDQEKSGAEIIALGFKPATVQKAQRQWRQENPISEPAPPEDMTAPLAAGSDPQASPEPKEEDDHLIQQLGTLEEQSEAQSMEIASLQEQLSQTSERTAQLETEAGEVPALRERAAALEPMAASADQWQKKHNELEDRLSNTVAAMDQELKDWQGRFTEEQKARKEAEDLAEGHSAEADRLIEANREEQSMEIAALHEQLAQTSERIAQLETQAGEVAALRERAAALEPMAVSADMWQRKYHDLEDRLGPTIAAMSQEVQDWQGKFTEEQVARKEAEALVEGHSAEADRLMEANRELQQKLQSLPDRLAQELWELVQPLNDELEELRPLKVWSGHTCAPQ